MMPEAADVHEHEHVNVHVRIVEVDIVLVRVLVLKNPMTSTGPPTWRSLLIRFLIL